MSWIKKAWHDPVGSKVIATLIISLLGLIGLLFTCQQSHTPNEPKPDNKTIAKDSIKSNSGKDKTTTLDTFELYSDNEEINDITDKIEGDFDGDGKKDIAWVIQKLIEINEEINEPFHEYFIKFSSQKLPLIKHKGYKGIYLINEGDLNDDGKDDISILNLEGDSGWKIMSVYAFTSNKWQKLTDLHISIALDPQLNDCVQKFKKGEFEVIEGDMINGGSIHRTVQTVPY